MCTSQKLYESVGSSRLSSVTKWRCEQGGTELKDVGTDKKVGWAR